MFAEEWRKLPREVSATTVQVPIPVFREAALLLGKFQLLMWVWRWAIIISKYQMMSTGVLHTAGARHRTLVSLGHASNRTGRSGPTSHFTTLGTGPSALVGISHIWGKVNTQILRLGRSAVNAQRSPYRLNHSRLLIMEHEEEQQLIHRLRVRQLPQRPKTFVVATLGVGNTTLLCIYPTTCVVTCSPKIWDMLSMRFWKNIRIPCKVSSTTSGIVGPVSHSFEGCRKILLSNVKL